MAAGSRACGSSFVDCAPSRLALAGAESMAVDVPRQVVQNASAHTQTPSFPLAFTSRPLSIPPIPGSCERRPFCASAFSLHLRAVGVFFSFFFPSLSSTWQLNRPFQGLPGKTRPVPPRLWPAPPCPPLRPGNWLEHPRIHTNQPTAQPLPTHDLSARRPSCIETSPIHLLLTTSRPLAHCITPQPPRRDPPQL